MESKAELKFIFANVNDWLKFAEAKHGGLIVFNAGFIIGIISSYTDIQHLFYKPTILIGVLCFGISAFLSLISQFPTTQNLFYSKKAISNPNLYFFGHLSSLDNQSFTNAYKAIDTAFTPSNFDHHLIQQILTNARIAQAKLESFKWASCITAFGAGLIGLSSIIKIIWHF